MERAKFRLQELNLEIVHLDLVGFQIRVVSLTKMQTIAILPSILQCTISSQPRKQENWDIFVVCIFLHRLAIDVD